MLGNDRVVIGAPGGGTTGPDTGPAYVFSINGTLLVTFNNPTPATSDRFGSRRSESVLSVGPTLRSINADPGLAGVDRAARSDTPTDEAHRSGPRDHLTLVAGVCRTAGRHACRVARQIDSIEEAGCHHPFRDQGNGQQLGCLVAQEKAGSSFRRE
jgi:hypothetical protein